MQYNSVRHIIKRIKSRPIFLNTCSNVKVDDTSLKNKRGMSWAGWGMGCNPLF